MNLTLTLSDLDFDLDRKSFTYWTLYFLFEVNRTNICWVMTKSLKTNFDIWWPWPLILTSPKQSQSKLDQGRLIYTKFGTLGQTGLKLSRRQIVYRQTDRQTDRRTDKWTRVTTKTPPAGRPRGKNQNTAQNALHATNPWHAISYRCRFTIVGNPMFKWYLNDCCVCVCGHGGGGSPISIRQDSISIV